MKEAKRGYSADPRALVLALGIVSVFPLLLGGWRPVLVSGATLAILSVLLGITPLTLVRSTGRVIWFIFFITVTNGLTTSGHVVFSAGPFVLTTEGLLTGVHLSARLLLLLWGSSILFRATTPAGLIDAIGRVSPFTPDHSGSFVMLLSVTINLVPGLIRQARRVSLSLRARGIQPAGIRQRMLFFTSAATPLFGGIGRMAGQLATAMESRGYDPLKPRTSFAQLRFRWSDWLLVGSALAIAGVSLVLL